MKNNYSLFEQLLHKVSVGNSIFNEVSFDLEKSLFLAKSSNLNPKLIFISGLARSGTTSLLNHLNNQGNGHSLTYQDLPFLFMPNLSKRWSGQKKTSEPTERAHGDNILISEDSPEAIDEIFWKNQLRDKYIESKNLAIHELSENDLQEYKNFIQLHLSKSKKTIYLTKNNNSIVRLNALMNQSVLDANFIFAIRNPFDHTRSLLKQHLQFSNLHAHDAFSLTYFNSLGHFEFGLNLKSFDLKNDTLNTQILALNPTQLDYWLVTWLNYYTYLFRQYSNRWTMVDFMDLCKYPNEVMKSIHSRLGFAPTELAIKTYQPPLYQKDDANYSENLLSSCQELYDKLKPLCLTFPSSE